MRNPRDLRKRAGVRADTHKDQYFLEDERVLDRIGSHAAETGMSLDHVLEIGPGTGALTARLLDIATHVTAIERDDTLVAFLEGEFAPEVANDRLTIVHGDALEVPLPQFSSCIANLPYGISSEIIFRLLPHGRPLLVMVQREFGERMAASPGTDAYGRLSVTAQHFGNITVREIVPPSVFEPQPPVDSAIVHVEPKEPEYTLAEEELFFDVVRALFTQRRKTVRNAIRNTVHISGIERPDDLVDQLPEALVSARPDTLTPGDYALIANTAAES